MLKAILLNLGYLLLLALVAGYGGAWHPALDTVAVFRIYVSGALVLVGLGLFWRRLRLAALVMALPGLVAGAITLSDNLRGAQAGHAGFALYQKNMLFRMPDPARLGQDILGHRPDFVTLQEVSGVNMAIFDTLGEEYEAHLQCPFATIGGVAVASRWPEIAGTAFCAEHDGMAGMRVMTGQGPVWIVSIHLHWPWPQSQPAQAARLRRMLSDLEGPVVIGGDFNMVPWSDTVQRFEAVSNTRRIGPAYVTLEKLHGALRVPIDHVMVTGGAGTTRRLPKLGSDHFGLLASFDLPRG